MLQTTSSITSLEDAYERQKQIIRDHLSELLDSVLKEKQKKQKILEIMGYEDKITSEIMGTDITTYRHEQQLDTLAKSFNISEESMQWNEETQLIKYNGQSQNESDLVALINYSNQLHSLSQKTHEIFTPFVEYIEDSEGIFIDQQLEMVTKKNKIKEKFETIKNAFEQANYSIKQSGISLTQTLYHDLQILIGAKKHLEGNPDDEATDLSKYDSEVEKNLKAAQLDYNTCTKESIRKCNEFKPSLLKTQLVFQVNSSPTSPSRISGWLSSPKKEQPAVVAIDHQTLEDNLSTEKTFRAIFSQTLFEPYITYADAKYAEKKKVFVADYVAYSGLVRREATQLHEKIEEKSIVNNYQKIKVNVEEILEGLTELEKDNIEVEEAEKLKEKIYKKIIALNPSIDSFVCPEKSEFFQKELEEIKANIRKITAFRNGYIRDILLPNYEKQTAAIQKEYDVVIKLKPQDAVKELAKLEENLRKITPLGDLPATFKQQVSTLNEKFNQLQEKIVLSLYEQRLAVINERHNAIFEKENERKSFKIKSDDQTKLLVSLQEDLNSIPLLPLLSDSFQLRVTELTQSFKKLQAEVALSILRVQLDKLRNIMYETNNDQFSFFCQPHKKKSLEDYKTEKYQSLSKQLTELKLAIEERKEAYKISFPKSANDFESLIEQVVQTFDVSKKLENHYGELHKPLLVEIVQKTTKSQQETNIQNCQKIKNLITSLLNDPNFKKLQERIEKISGDDKNQKKRTKKEKFGEFIKTLENMKTELEGAVPSNKPALEYLELLNGLINNKDYHTHITANTSFNVRTPSKELFEKFRDKADSLIKTTEEEIKINIQKMEREVSEYTVGYSPSRVQ